MSNSDGGRTVVIVSYVLHLIGACTGLLSIVALIINYVAKGEHGELMDSHHNWMIRTFWWALLWFVVVGLAAALTWIILIGWFIAGIGFIAIWIWFVYRHIKGLIDLSSDRPMPA